MKLRVIRIGLLLAANALGLLISSLTLDDNMSVSGLAFFIAVLVFTALILILDPVVETFAVTYADYLIGVSALMSTALALLFTDWISDGLSIDGIGTWLLATLLVWVVTAIAGVALGRLARARLVD